MSDGTYIVIYLHNNDGSGNFISSSIFAWEESSYHCALAVGDVLEVDGDDFVAITTEISYNFWLTLTSDGIWRHHNRTTIPIVTGPRDILLSPFLY